MKILAIGDLHTKTDDLQRFDDAIALVKPDKVVLMGDYLDDWGAGMAHNLAMFYKLVTWIDAHDTVIALTGNHDYAYLDTRAPAPGKTKGIEGDVAELIEGRWGSAFVLAFGVDNWLFTHAGVTDGWWRLTNELAESATEMAEKINDFYASSIGSNYLNMVGRKRGGNNKHASPLWADRMELIQDPLLNPSLSQCVGHSPVSSVDVVDNPNSSILVFCDTFSTNSYGYPLGDESLALIDTETNVLQEICRGGLLREI